MRPTTQREATTTTGAPAATVGGRRGPPGRSRTPPRARPKSATSDRRSDRRHGRRSVADRGPPGRVRVRPPGLPRRRVQRPGQSEEAPDRVELGGRVAHQRPRTARRARTAADGRSATNVSCAANQFAIGVRRVRPRSHLSVPSATTTGCRTITTNDACGNSACRNRVITRFGGDFSTSTGRDRSQCAAHCSARRAALPGVASGESSVRCARGSSANRPGPPYVRAAG